MSRSKKNGSSFRRREFLKYSAASVGAMGALGGADALAAPAETPAAVAGTRQSTARSLGKSKFNGEYSGERLNRVAFPLGGIGAGMICLEGSGALSHFSLRNKPEVFNEPCTFAAICIKGPRNVARVLEGPVPGWKLFGAPGTGNGAGRRVVRTPSIPSGHVLDEVSVCHGPAQRPQRAAGRRSDRLEPVRAG